MFFLNPLLLKEKIIFLSGGLNFLLVIFSLEFTDLVFQNFDIFLQMLVLLLDVSKRSVFEINFVLQLADLPYFSKAVLILRMTVTLSQYLWTSVSFDDVLCNSGLGFIHLQKMIEVDDPFIGSDEFNFKFLQFLDCAIESPIFFLLPMLHLNNIWLSPQ